MSVHCNYCGQAKYLPSLARKLQKENEELEAKLKVAVEALEFYANSGVPRQMLTEQQKNQDFTARMALKEINANNVHFDDLDQSHRVLYEIATSGFGNNPYYTPAKQAGFCLKCIYGSLERADEALRAPHDDELGRPTLSNENQHHGNPAREG